MINKYTAIWDDSDWWFITYLDENNKTKVYLSIEGHEDDTRAKIIADSLNLYYNELIPEWSEEEYILVSDIWRIYKNNPGTIGKKASIE